MEKQTVGQGWREEVDHITLRPDSFRGPFPNGTIELKWKVQGES